MDFTERLQRRRSVRKFEPRPIEREKLDAVLAAIVRAPSAGNLQASWLGEALSMKGNGSLKASRS
jgi:nitroreductase